MFQPIHKIAVLFKSTVFNRLLLYTLQFRDLWLVIYISDIVHYKHCTLPIVYIILWCTIKIYLFIHSHSFSGLYCFIHFSCQVVFLLLFNFICYRHLHHIGVIWLECARWQKWPQYCSSSSMHELFGEVLHPYRI